jgi:hypothetical protein
MPTNPLLRLLQLAGAIVVWGLFLLYLALVLALVVAYWAVTQDPYKVEVNLLTPLTRFIRRSRVKPTEFQIEAALADVDALRALIRQLRTTPPAPQDIDA